jgi:hypothetical protein
MTVEQTRKVDFVGVDRSTGRVVLTITDHLPWDSDDHLQILQDKLNSYLAFIERGELVSQYPDASGRVAEIAVLFRHPPSAMGIDFLHRASARIKNAGIEFSHQTADGL